MSDAGRRCTARRGLQFDHIQKVARGGEATVSGIRLLCRAHNQYGAERTFGVEFMRHKRVAAAEARGQGEGPRNRGQAGPRRRAPTAGSNDRRPQFLSCFACQSSRVIALTGSSFCFSNPVLIAGRSLVPIVPSSAWASAICVSSAVADTDCDWVGRPS